MVIGSFDVKEDVAKQSKKHKNDSVENYLMTPVIMTLN